MALTVKRSDKFPVGTVVSAYSPPSNRHHAGKPSGVAVATATVDASGTLTFAVEPGVYNLYAEVAGDPVNLRAGSEEFVPPGTLKARLAARKLAAGV